MAILTIAEINDILAQHRRIEEANRTPYAQALGALTTLRESLAMMGERERDEIVAEIRELVDEQPIAATA